MSNKYTFARCDNEKCDKFKRCLRARSEHSVVDYLGASKSRSMCDWFIPDKNEVEVKDEK